MIVCLRAGRGPPPDMDYGVTVECDESQSLRPCENRCGWEDVDERVAGEKLPQTKTEATGFGANEPANTDTNALQQQKFCCTCNKFIC